jgi:hypothetical protein
MIGTPTALVIGAGASWAYGMPLGEGLLLQAQALTPKSEIYGLLASNRTPPGAVAELDACLNDIRRYHGPSIDSFLENQPRHREIGHEIIAAFIGQAARKAGDLGRCQDPSEDWLGYVTEHMRQGASRFADFVQGNRKLAFITFNFDSVIENRLLAAANGYYNIGREAATAVGAIHVVHVHGRLPRLDRPLSSAWIRDSARQIKVIHDELDRNVVLHAREILKQARVICFLGFHYRRENLQTLGLLENIHDQWSPQWYGSAYGHEDGEQSRVRRIFGRKKIVLGLKDGNCRDMLRRHDILRD